MKKPNENDDKYILLIDDKIYIYDTENDSKVILTLKEVEAINNMIKLDEIR